MSSAIGESTDLSKVQLNMQENVRNRNEEKAWYDTHVLCCATFMQSNQVKCARKTEKTWTNVTFESRIY